METRYILHIQPVEGAGRVFSRSFGSLGDAKQYINLYDHTYGYGTCYTLLSVEATGDVAPMYKYTRPTPGVVWEDLRR